MRALIWIAVVAVAALVYFFTIGNQPGSEPGESPGVASAPAAAASIGLIDDDRINKAEDEPGNWLAYGRTYEEQRYSPLTQINKTNVSDLGLAWYKDMGTNRAQEATPIVVDGIMFFTSTWSRVFAVEAATGETVWSYDPEVPGAWGRRACCDVVTSHHLLNQDAACAIYVFHDRNRHKLALARSSATSTTHGSRVVARPLPVEQFDFFRLSTVLGLAVNLVQFEKHI